MEHFPNNYWLDEEIYFLRKNPAGLTNSQKAQKYFLENTQYKNKHIST
jgi:hypothetical protein